MSSGSPTPSGFMMQRVEPAKIRTALTFFKVMATVVGIGLLLLCLEMILRYGFGNHALDWWPMPHGFLYMIYLAAVANLGFKTGWSLWQIVLVMLAGVIPFLSFVVERNVARQIEGVLARRTAVSNPSNGVGPA